MNVQNNPLLANVELNLDEASAVVIDQVGWCTAFRAGLI